MEFGFINEGWFSFLAGIVLNIVIAEGWRRLGPYHPALSYTVRREGSWRSLPAEEDNWQLTQRLQLRFDEKVVTRFESFIVRVWNGQRIVINSTDVAKRDPLRLRLGRSGGQILGAELIWNGDTGCDFTLVLSQDEVEVKFDYIGHLQGVKVLVFTTPNPPPPDDTKSWKPEDDNPLLEFVGTLKNVRLFRLPSPGDASPLMIYRKPIIRAVVLSLVLAGVMQLGSFFVHDPWDDMLRTMAWVTFFFWQFFAWVPFGIAEGYYKTGFHVPQKLR